MIGSNGTFGYCKELYEFMGNGAYLAVDHMLEVRTAGIKALRPRTTYPMLRDRHPQIGLEGGVSGWLAKKRAACEEATAKTIPFSSSRRNRTRDMRTRSNALLTRSLGKARKCAA